MLPLSFSSVIDAPFSYLPNGDLLASAQLTNSHLKAESILLFVCLVQWKLETMRKRLAATTSIDTAPRNVQIAG